MKTVQEVLQKREQIENERAALRDSKPEFPGESVQKMIGHIDSWQWNDDGGLRITTSWMNDVKNVFIHPANAIEFCRQLGACVGMVMPPADNTVPANSPIPHTYDGQADAPS